MCQSKAEGGRRCAAHNNQKEHSRAKRELKAAVATRDYWADRVEAGTASGAELAAAEHEVLVKTDLVMLLDPKLDDEELEKLWEKSSPEVQAAARPVAASAIAHGRKAAKLSGEAATARMFDRTEEADQFELEAEEERGKALRLVDALRAALTDTKTVIGEGIADAASGGVMGVLRDFASETADALREGVSEFAEQMDSALTETVENLAAGVGISPTETGRGEQSSDGGESESEDEHDKDAGVDGDSGEDAAVNDSGDDSEDTAAAEDVDDSSDDDPGNGPAPAPAKARDADTPAAEAVDGDSASASDGRGLARVLGQNVSPAPSSSAGVGQDKSQGTSAGGRRAPSPGIGRGNGNGVTPKPQPVPMRQVEAEPTAGVMGTPQKEPSFDVTKLTDSELLGFIARLYERLRT